MNKLKASVSVAVLLGHYTIGIANIAQAAGRNPTSQMKSDMSKKLDTAFTFVDLFLKTPITELGIDSDQKMLAGKKTLGDVLGLIEPENTKILIAHLETAVCPFTNDAKISKKITPIIKKLTAQVEQAEGFAMQTGGDAHTGDAGTYRTSPHPRQPVDDASARL